MSTKVPTKDAWNLLVSKGCGAYVGEGRCGQPVTGKFNHGNADFYTHIHTAAIVNWVQIGDTLRPLVVAALCAVHERDQAALVADADPGVMRRADIRAAAFKRPPIVIDGVYAWVNEVGQVVQR